MRRRKYRKSLMSVLLHFLVTILLCCHIFPSLSYLIILQSCSPVSCPIFLVSYMSPSWFFSSLLLMFIRLSLRRTFLQPLLSGVDLFSDIKSATASFHFRNPKSSSCWRLLQTTSILRLKSSKRSYPTFKIKWGSSRRHCMGDLGGVLIWRRKRRPILGFLWEKR
jgi:hypothetical protein